MRKRIFIGTVIFSLAMVAMVSAVDFDNTDFTPNFTGLNIRTDAYIDNILFTKELRYNTNNDDKFNPPANANLQIFGQVDFQGPIGAIGDGPLRFSSDLKTTGTILTDNISSTTNLRKIHLTGDTQVDDLYVGNSINPLNGDQVSFGTNNLYTTGIIKALGIQGVGNNSQAVAIDRINRTASKLENLVDYSNATYKVDSAYNDDFLKIASCNQGDIVLSCVPLTYPGIKAAFVYPNVSDGVHRCEGLFYRTNETLLNGQSYTDSRVTAYCLDLN